MIDPRIYEALPVFITTKEGIEILKEAREHSHIGYLCLRLDRVTGQNYGKVHQLSCQVRDAIWPNHSLGGFLYRNTKVDPEMITGVNDALLRDVWIDKLIKFNEGLNHV